MVQTRCYPYTASSLLRKFPGLEMATHIIDQGSISGVWDVIDIYDLLLL